MDTLPWYKQFWPWFIMALPATVVVAGLTTWYIAEQGADHMVVQDYYKEGLSINRELDKQKYATELGLQAELVFSDSFVEASLVGEANPAGLELLLSHPMDENLDLALKMVREAPGRYRAQLPEALSHRWHWQLEPLASPGEKLWRLDGEVTIIPADDSR